jgi:arylsulfatase A-like enzyme
LTPTACVNYGVSLLGILFGAGVRPGRYNGDCSTSDIAPTLVAILGIEPPSNRTGRVLVEALAPPIQTNAGTK